MLSKINFTFRGLCAAIFTPLNEDLSLNIKIIPKYAQYLADKGIDGVLINGTTSEGMAMTVAERRSLAEEWTKATKARKQHLMVQVGGCPLPDVLNLAEHADKIGVGSLLCLPELYYKPETPEDLINYLKMVSAAAPNTPLFYYHSPGMTHVTFNLAEYVNKLDEIPTFAGIKYITSELEAAITASDAFKASGKNYKVFMSSNLVLLEAFTKGIDCSFPTTLSIFPEYSQKISQAVKDGKLNEAREIQNKLKDIANVLTKEGNWLSNMKVAMNLFTPIHVGKARPPINNPTEEQIENMRKSLEKILK